MSEPEFRPEEILRVLNERSVRFVLIGGFAAVIQIGRASCRERV